MASWNASSKYSKGASAIYQSVAYTSLANANQGNIPLYSPAWWVAGSAPSGGVKSISAGSGVSVSGTDAVVVSANLAVVGAGLSIDPGAGTVLNLANEGVLSLVSTPGITLNGTDNQRTPQVGIVDIGLNIGSGIVSSVTGANGVQVSPTTGNAVVTGPSIVGDAQTLVGLSGSTWSVKPAVVTSGSGCSVITTAPSGSTQGSYQVSNTGVLSLSTAGTGLVAQTNSVGAVTVTGNGLVSVTPVTADSGLVATTDGAGNVRMATSYKVVTGPATVALYPPSTAHAWEFVFVAAGGGGGGGGGFYIPNSNNVALSGGGGGSGNVARGSVSVPPTGFIQCVLGAGGVGGVSGVEGVNNATNGADGQNTSLSLGQIVGGATYTYPFCTLGYGQAGRCYLDSQTAGSGGQSGGIVSPAPFGIVEYVGCGGGGGSAQASSTVYQGTGGSGSTQNGGNGTSQVSGTASGGAGGGNNLKFVGAPGSYICTGGSGGGVGGGLGGCSSTQPVGYGGFQGGGGGGGASGYDLTALVPIVGNGGAGSPGFVSYAWILVA